jgi:hypothetical protein
MECCVKTNDDRRLISADDRWLWWHTLSSEMPPRHTPQTWNNNSLNSPQKKRKICGENFETDILKKRKKERKKCVILRAHQRKQTMLVYWHAFPIFPMAYQTQEVVFFDIYAFLTRQKAWHLNLCYSAPPPHPHPHPRPQPWPTTTPRTPTDRGPEYTNL